MITQFKLYEGATIINGKEINRGYYIVYKMKDRPELNLMEVISRRVSTGNLDLEYIYSSADGRDGGAIFDFEAAWFENYTDVFCISQNKYYAKKIYDKYLKKISREQSFDL